MHRNLLGVLFPVLLAAAPAALGQDLSPAEKKLTQTVEARLGEEMAPDGSVDPTSIGPATTRAAVVIARLLHPTN